MDSTKPASTREKLLDAAAKAFLAHGFAAASMDMVRQEAGVSNGSLYHHFPTKALLADALYAHTLRNFHAALLGSITKRSTAQSGVKGLIRAYISWVEANPARACLLHELRRTGDMTGGAEMGAANEQAFGTLVQWIDGKAAAGEMRAMPFQIWMAVVFSPAISLTPHWASQGRPAVATKVRAALEHAAWMAVAT